MTDKPSPLSLTSVIDEYDYDEWGFTGTRAGMTEFQGHMLRRILVRGKPSIFRHGGAWGSDMQAHVTWKQIRNKTMRANVWPAHENRAALFRGDLAVVVETPMDALSRNICIVDRSKLIIAAPNKEYEEQRSGTWQTIREAMKRHRPVLILWPQSQKLTLHRDDVLYRVTYTPKEP